MAGEEKQYGQGKYPLQSVTVLSNLHKINDISYFARHFLNVFAALDFYIFVGDGEQIKNFKSKNC
jgi:hypothetical protein